MTLFQLAMLDIGLLILGYALIIALSCYVSYQYGIRNTLRDFRSHLQTPEDQADGEDAIEHARRHA